MTTVITSATSELNSQLRPRIRCDSGHIRKIIRHECWRGTATVNEVGAPCHNGSVRLQREPMIIASEGDVVYVPPFTFHAPRFYGEGPSCRLAMNGYPNIAHLFESEAPH